MVSPDPLARARARAGRLPAALVVHVLFVALIAAILVLLTAIRSILIRASAFGGLAIAVAEVLLATILIPSRRALFALLILVSFLIGHEIPPRLFQNASDVPFRLITSDRRFTR